ncbi:MAG: hypothetical protein U0Q16_08170 [Bryobacteraceae bacterium]
MRDHSVSSLRASVPLLALILVASAAWAQEATGPIKAPFRDPSRPGTVKITLVRGSITVKGYAGNEVIVEAVRPSGGTPAPERKPDPDSAGMHRILGAPLGLTVEEENNSMRISANPSRRTDLVVQVPVKTALKLSTVHGANVSVENVEGEIEVSNIHGAVTLTGVSGAAVAHALHGNVKAVFAKVDGAKPMSFTSLHGNIDVTLPGDTRADLKMQTERGEVWSDFDVSLGPSSAKVEEEKGGGNAKYKIGFPPHALGRINGGGPEMLLKTLHGNIYIRKSK